MSRDPGNLGPSGPRACQFAVFLSVTDGWAAFVVWMLDARYLRWIRTARDMVKVFAPPAGNDIATYTAEVAAALGEGELALGNRQVQRALCMALVRWEQANGVWDEAVLDDGLMAASSYWPIFRAQRDPNV